MTAEAEAAGRGEFRFLVKGDALEALEQVRAITGREKHVDVVIDAVKVYEWILQQQTCQRRILSITPIREQGIELPSFIKNFAAARSYFAFLFFGESPNVPLTRGVAQPHPGSGFAVPPLLEKEDDFMYPRTDQNQLEDARALTAPLRRLYGTILAGIVLLTLILSVLPIPVPVFAIVGSILLLAATFVGLRWHIRALRAVNDAVKGEAGG